MLFSRQGSSFRLSGFLKRGVLAACIAAISIASGVGDAASQQKLRKINVGFPITAMNATFCMLPLASEVGILEDEGLEAEYPLIAGSAQVIQLLLAGNLDIGVATPEPLFKLVSEGADLILIYNFVRSPAASIAVLADSPYQKLEDLKGKSIGAQSLASGNIMLSNVGFGSVGVDFKKDIKYVAVGIGAQALHALQSKHVEGLTLWDSAYADMERSGAKLRYLRAPLQDRLFSTQLVIKRSKLDSEAALIRSVGRALAKATYIASERPEACVRAMWKMFPTTKPIGTDQKEQLAYLASVVKRRMALLINSEQQKNGFGSYPRDDVALWNDTAVTAGLTKKKVDNLELLFTNRFVADYNDWDKDEVLKRVSRLPNN